MLALPLQLTGSLTWGKSHSPSRLPFLICEKDGAGGGSRTVSHLSSSLLLKTLNEPVPETLVEARDQIGCITGTMVLSNNWLDTYWTGASPSSFL